MTLGTLFLLIQFVYSVRQEEPPKTQKSSEAQSMYFHRNVKNNK